MKLSLLVLLFLAAADPPPHEHKGPADEPARCRTRKEAYGGYWDLLIEVCECRHTCTADGAGYWVRLHRGACR